MGEGELVSIRRRRARFFQITGSGWIQDVVDKDVATVAIGPKD